MTIFVNLSLFRNSVLGFEAGVSNQPQKLPTEETPKQFDPFFGLLSFQQQGPHRAPPTVPRSVKKPKTEFKIDPTLPSPGGPTRPSATVPEKDRAQRVAGSSQGSNKKQEDAKFFLNFVAIYEYRLKRQKTSINSEEQLDDLNYLKQNFKKFTKILKENVNNKVNFNRTLENLPTDKHTLRENHHDCIKAAQRYLDYPNQDLSFQQRAIKERIEELTPKKLPTPIKTTYIEDSERSPQTRAVIAERRHASRVARKQGKILQSISPEEREQLRYNHAVRTNPKPFMCGNKNLPKINVIGDPPPRSFQDALTDSILSPFNGFLELGESTLKLAGKGVEKFKKSDTYTRIKYVRDHAIDEAAKRAEPSSMHREDLSYRLAKTLWANQKNTGGRGGGGGR